MGEEILKSVSVFLSAVVRVLFSSNLGQIIGPRRNTSDIPWCKSEENQGPWGDSREFNIFVQ